MSEKSTATTGADTASEKAAEPEKAAAVKTVTAKLRCLDHRGETVNTRWGDVSFDKDGLAELEVPEAELPMLRDIKPYSWLVDDHVSFNKPKARVKK